MTMTLWDTAQIAAAFGLQRRTVTERLTKRPDFPKPVVRLSRKVVRWDAEAVKKWAAK